MNQQTEEIPAKDFSFHETEMKQYQTISPFQTEIQITAQNEVSTLSETISIATSLTRQNQIQDQIKCRICGSNENHRSLIRACLCKGESEYIHSNCLYNCLDMEQYVEKSFLDEQNIISYKCQICKDHFSFTLDSQLSLRQGLHQRQQQLMIAILFLLVQFIVIGSAITCHLYMYQKNEFTILLVVSMAFLLSSLTTISYMISICQFTKWNFSDKYQTRDAVQTLRLISKEWTSVHQ